MSSAANFLDANGPLAAHLNGYEKRDGQLEMTRAVEQSITNGGVLLSEAGTGIGKTLAYLVPAIQSDQTVVVSTGTKNLQEQIFFKDIVFLEEITRQPIDAVYLKGQDNYLCLRRLDEFLNSPRVLTVPAERVTALEKWARETDTGDRMELSILRDEDPLWREVCSFRDTRIGAKCRYHSECYVTLARKRAASARIVVVNHHLYFADLATRLKGGAILPQHDAVVFDEAHAIEDVATEFFSVKVSSARCERLISDVERTIRIAKIADDPAETRRKKLIQAAISSVREFFPLFKNGEGRSLLVPEELDSVHVSAYHRLDAALDALLSTLKVLEGREETVDHVAGRLELLRNDLATVISQSTSGFVHWLERRKRSTVLGASPIDVSETLREGIFFSIPAVVLTSATLSAGGNFDFLKGRLGIDFDVDELSLSSPFDFEQQARIYLPEQLPDPRDPGFAAAAAKESLKLMTLTNGGALLLFTSFATMSQVHALLSEQWTGEMMIQGESPRSVLLERFIRTPDSVLCATSSFWQGVDIPGEALRLVVIDKLPFASPADPLISARVESIREQGGTPFTQYQVPQAALALKQGFGRLIRSRNDSGIVAILDRRIKSMSYGPRFLSSLPACPELSRYQDVVDWWSGITTGPETGESPG